MATPDDPTRLPDTPRRHEAEALAETAMLLNLALELADSITDSVLAAHIATAQDVARAHLADLRATAI